MSVAVEPPLERRPQVLVSVNEDCWIPGGGDWIILIGREMLNQGLLKEQRTNYCLSPPFNLNCYLNLALP